MLKKLIDKLLCLHKWDFIEEWKVKDIDNITGNATKVALHKEYHCTECGKIKIIKINS